MNRLLSRRVRGVNGRFGKEWIQTDVSSDVAPPGKLEPLPANGLSVTESGEATNTVWRDDVSASVTLALARGHATRVE